MMVSIALCFGLKSIKKGVNKMEYVLLGMATGGAVIIVTEVLMASFA